MVWLILLEMTGLRFHDVDGVKQRVISDAVNFVFTGLLSPKVFGHVHILAIFIIIFNLHRGKMQ